MAKKSSRELKYEVIRVVAMIFVIAIHQIDAIAINNNIYYYISLILLTCNPMFFMLSGKFALKFNYEEKGCYKKYYLNKLIKILVPVFIYMIIKEWHVLTFVFKTEITPYVFIKSLFLSIVEGFSVTEYWFIYTLIANLIAVPFTSRIFRNLNKNEMKLFFGIGLAYHALITYLPLVGASFQLPYYLAGYSLYFYFGYCIDTLIKTKKEKKWIFILGILSYIISIIQLYLGKSVNIYDMAPTFFFISCMVYIILRDYVKLDKIKKVIFFLGKYSFSIYLLHVMMMDITSIIFSYNGMFMPLYIIIKIIMILISSLVLAIILDNTIVKWSKNIVSKIIRIQN